MQATRNNNNNAPEKFIQIIIMLMVSVCMVCMCSCSPKTHIEYVDREVIKYQTQYVHDTTFVAKHDSIFHTIYQKGDTVFDTKYVERTRYKDRIVIKTDTCYKDSIDVQYKEITIEKRVIPKWCYYTLAGCFLLVGWIAFKIYKWWITRRL